MAVLNFKDWQLRSVEGPAAAQLDHKSRQIAVTGDIPEGYSWDLLVMAPSGAADVWSLAAVGDGLAVVVTRGMVPEEGRYAVQLRGTLQSDNDTQRHTNIVQLRVLPSITAGSKWPVLPTEFSQAEARLRDIAAHPPIPGNGVWQLWNSDTGAYEDSELPLPSGVDGVTPHIGDNGNWYLGDEDTGVAAKGVKGDTGPQGPKGGDGAKGDTGPQGPKGDDGAKGDTGPSGADGVTPHIGDNGNWYLGDEDTGVAAKGAKGDAGAQGPKGATGPAGPQGPAGAPGKDGSDGADGVTPHIGDNGNWYIGSTDTGKPSKGEQGPGAEVFYIELAGSYPNYTCPVAMADIKAAYEAGKVLECRFAMGQYIATLPLFLPMPSANTWIFSGSGSLTEMGFDAQSLTIAIVNGTVQASDTRLASKDDIPSIPAALPNPNALTIKIGSTTVTYDGSSAQTVEIADGTEVSY